MIKKLAGKYTTVEEMPFCFRPREERRGGEAGRGQEGLPGPRKEKGRRRRDREGRRPWKGRERKGKVERLVGKQV